MSASSKPRQPRLRASCDGCFLAKVKCSKARPICSRCLACGIECRYSPSTRAGKPKSDHNSCHQISSASDISGLSPITDDKAMMFTTQVHMPGLYRIDTGWNTPPAILDGLNPPLLVDEMSAREAEMMAAAAAAGADMYTTGMPWTPPNDFSGTTHFADAPAMVTPMPQPGQHNRSHSFDVSMSSNNMSTWAEHAQDMFTYGQSHISTPASMGNYFPSPSSTPTLRPQVRNKAPPSNPASTIGGGGNALCACFATCLQSLQALHNASCPLSSPAFDVVLSLNRNAVDACSTLLGCTRCMSRSGTHTAVMLMATLMGKITTCYKNAAQMYFDCASGSNMSAAAAAAAAAMMGPSGNSNNGSGGSSSRENAPASGNSPVPLNLGGCLGVSFGTYKINTEDGRWLELEILAREMRKLEEFFARFQEAITDLSDDAEVAKVMTSYLGQSLVSALEVVGSYRKESMAFV